MAMASLPARLDINRKFVSGQPNDLITLRSNEELPVTYRPVFAAHPYFNILQSMVFNEVMHSDRGIVVSAPTGCGKTGVFELAICRMLSNRDDLGLKHVAKAVYLAPVKAICDERYADWSERFGRIGCRCCKLTGDTDNDEFIAMKEADIVVATPEKWDSMTRRWKDNECLVKMIRVFMIDEVHLVGDQSRGATLETVVSRMKAISEKLRPVSGGSIRFVAVSATLQNIEDFAEWLGSDSEKALAFKLSETMRPVPIQKVVLAFPLPANGGDFKFDMSLDYKLGEVLTRFSAGKPSLIFCATRKSAERAAGVLKKQAAFVFSEEVVVLRAANSIRNGNLADSIRCGVGFHHAGLDRFDRSIVEDLFTQGHLPVLLSTSTLAMGVNLPAHLVIVKSTSTYGGGNGPREYSDTDIMQMIGRAGRPQFDTSATAVIMTKPHLRARFEGLTRGIQVTESVLHNYLIEHVNAEINLKTFSDSKSMLAWLKSTFLYLRVFKNPEYYHLGEAASVSNAHNWLQLICSDNLRALKVADLISGDAVRFQSTIKGALMANYYVTFETMALFNMIRGKETISELLTRFCDAREFADMQLRVNEKMTLNTLNRSKENAATIRFPMKGKITNTATKVNCLIQAVLGALIISDNSLQADANKIMRASVRIARCLVAVVRTSKIGYCATIAALQLAKCLEAQMWENSPMVARQIRGIGVVALAGLTNNGCSSFAEIANSNPRQIEIFVNRRPPFGNQLIDAINRLPKYELAVEQSDKVGATTSELIIGLTIRNCEALRHLPTAGANHAVFLFVGDEENACLLKERLVDSDLLSSGGLWRKTLAIYKSSAGPKIMVSLISESMIGVDVNLEIQPVYYVEEASVVGSTMVQPKSSCKTRQAVMEEYISTKKRKSDSIGYMPEVMPCDVRATHPPAKPAAAVQNTPPRMANL